MQVGKRNARSSAARRRVPARPVGEVLEKRIALAGNTIDLATVASKPLGVELDGFNAGSRVGVSTAYVGNVNANSVGYDDFLVSGPAAAASASQVFLVLGSQDATRGNVDWRTLTATQRIGNLQNLGNGGQPNGFNFTGQPFTILDSNATGATVAGVGDVNADGIPDFMIGFPNADGGAGRAYLVFGTAALTNLHTTFPIVNLAAPTTGLRVVAFKFANPSNALVAGSHAGASMASVFNAFADGAQSILIGAPDSNVGVQDGGAVYAIPASTFNATTTVFLDQLGQTGGQNGLVFTGANIGDRAGRSVTGLASFDGTTSNRGLLGDIVIGAPAVQEPSINSTGPGAAYLIYGANNLGTFAVVNSNGVRAVPLTIVGATGGVPGAKFVGQSDATGFAVASGGDFNNDGLSDLLIGSPNFQTATGEATLIYGRAASSAAGRITGTVSLGSIPVAIPAAQFVGAGTGAQAGWSVTAVGKINADAFNEILIGSPGFLNNAGAAYLIPGQASLTGTQQLSQATADPVDATVITLSTNNSSGSATPNRLGESLSGRLTPVNAAATIDKDVIGDFVIGAPDFSPTTATTGAVFRAGTVFGLEGNFVPLAIPSPAIQIPATIIVGTNASATPPFPVNSNAASLTFLVLDTNVPGKPVLHPFDDIDPTSITVDGHTYTGSQITFVNAGPVSGSGIDDAQITVTPLSALNLKPGLQTLTVVGKTKSTAPVPNAVWGGTTTIRVTAGPGPTPGPNPVPSPPANPFFSLFFPQSFNFVPPNGERLIPTISTLNRLTWKPIGFRVAFQQFQPTKPFKFRFENFFHPIETHPLGSRHEKTGFRTSTLGRDVFTRGLWHPGKPMKFSHNFPVLPTFLQTQGQRRSKNDQVIG